MQHASMAAGNLAAVFLIVGFLTNSVAGHTVHLQNCLRNVETKQFCLDEFPCCKCPLQFPVDNSTQLQIIKNSLILNSAFHRCNKNESRRYPQSKLYCFND